jgi:uncharacterized SAM-binding protein YcdF (DUF218 family)
VAVNGRRLIRSVISGVAIIVVGLLCFVVVSVVQVIMASEVSQDPSAVQPAAAIVVLGEPTPNGAVPADLRSRLEQALVLLQAKRASRIIVTGATTPGGKETEATVEATFLVKQGVSPSQIVQIAAINDPGALSAIKALALPSVGGHETVILVSDPLDGLRLRATAAADGLVPEISPATPPARGFWTDVGAVWTQAVAVSEGRVRGFGSTGWASS